MNSRNKNASNKTINNLFWRFAERISAQSISFLVSIILARILAPSDYGIIALVTVFMSILQVFVDSGLGTALIQKRDATDSDFSTVFWFNIVFCIILYGVIFLSAPCISNFYNNNDLTLIIRVLGIILLISGIKNVQQAYVSRQLIFRKFFYATLGGTIGAALVGISMAKLGFGVWALVGQQIFNALIDTIILWITVDWHPKLTFSFKRLRQLFKFGWKILMAQLVDTVYRDVRQLVIGKLYSSTDLAYYNRGNQFPNIIVTNINASIDSVLLPVMSDQQDNKIMLKKMTRQAISMSSYIMWPMMIGLLAIGKTLITIVLTDKWLPAYPFLCIFCIVKGFEPIHTANLNAIKAIGRSDILLKLEIVKKCIGIALILMTMHRGTLTLAFSSVIYTILAGIVNTLPNKKLLNCTYFEQFKDILPSLLMASVMGIVVYAVSYIKISVYLKLLFQMIIGISIYLILSFVFKIAPFIYIRNKIIHKG